MSSGPKNIGKSAIDETSGNFTLVGIGASAGGVQALNTFFQHVGKDEKVAYAVILHLSPDHDSKLAEVLQAVTALPVIKVTQKNTLQPDHVYVVPPNKHLTIDGNFIVATDNLEIEDRHAPVDIFFRSLAEAFGARSIGVILSGTGANGSMGLKRVKEVGGAVFVQNPLEAEYNEMPRHAIATELVDEVLPVSDIPKLISKYVSHLNDVNVAVTKEVRPMDEQHALREIFSQLRLRTGHDFSNYKRATLFRRLERRISVRNVDGLSGYAAYLAQTPEEANFLMKDLLISVTNFFRDKKAFEAFEKDVLPNIIKNKTQDQAVRIWVAGCATGEEAYSFAILCAELIQSKVDAPKIQIFATDIDEGALAKGREGIYTISEAADVSQERLGLFFRKNGDHYHIRREIRDMIVFANHSFLKDPPFSRVDIVSCRNVMIYLNHAAQERALETFHFALKKGGYFFMGSSETVASAVDLYEPYTKEHQIFRSREVKSLIYPLPESLPNPGAEKKFNQYQSDNKKQDDLTDFGDVHIQLLEKYGPPSLLLNADYDIVYLSKNVGRYLEVTGGQPTHHLFDLIRPELSLELRSALYRAAESGMDFRTRALQVDITVPEEIIHLHVRPVTTKGRTLFLLLFEPAGHEIAKEAVPLRDDPLSRHLEDELTRIKLQLRNSTEQFEFQAEELKAANEELQAMNEETRSASEELETSKEELQSMNEELRTVNQELKVKVEETIMASNNLHNLINSVDLATIFLDKALRVNFFTPAATAIFNLIPSDYGRLLSDITSHLDYEYLLKDAQKVLELLQPTTKEVTSLNGNIYLMRVLPYRTHEDRINGIVLTFFDITKQKAAEKELIVSEERLRLLIESAREYAIYTLDIEGKINSWNKGAELMFGYNEREVLGRTANIFLTAKDVEADIAADEIAKALTEGRVENKRLHVTKAGSLFWGSGLTWPLYDDANALQGFVKIMQDLTEEKNVELTLRQSEERLRITLESAVDYAVITMATNGTIISWSRGAELIFGYGQEDAIGQHVQLIFTPEDKINRVADKEMLSAEQNGRAIDERWHLRKDGMRFYMSGVMTPIMHEENIIGFVKVARDLTEQRLLEQQKEGFIGIASHELKTPITSMKIYAETLEERFDQKGDNVSGDMMRKINLQIDRLTKLITDLLDTTKIAEGRMPLYPELFDMVTLISEKVEDIQPTTGRLELVFEKQYPIMLVADRDRISQVIINLVTNAIKYSPQKGVVTINAVLNGDEVRVSVKDNGIGIPAHAQASVFERFFRVDGASLQTYPGMGLGLYICSGIIHRHSGTIGVTSDEGAGSTFYFTVPVAMKEK